MVRGKQGEFTLFSALSAKLSVCCHSIAAAGNQRGRKGIALLNFFPLPGLNL